MSILHAASEGQIPEPPVLSRAGAESADPQHDSAPESNDSQRTRETATGMVGKVRSHIGTLMHGLKNLVPAQQSAGS